jgi:putative oxidoreductase
MAQAKEMSGERPTLNPAQRDSTSNLDAVAAVADRGSATVPQFVWRIVGFIIGGVFIYAGAIKVFDPIGFANDIDNYRILPWAIGVRLAFYLPWLEILCGFALVSRRLYFGGLSILTGLISVFIVASIVAKARGLDITCGCFGHASKNWSFSAHLALDILLLAAVLALYFSSDVRRRGKEIKTPIET